MKEGEKLETKGGAPEVRVLIPVWGTRYIDDFVKFSLPSLLSPGNLPALAKSCRLTVVFLASQRNFDHFHEQPQISVLLASYCRIEYIPIDDLIRGTDSYSVPLTLAYFRGMTETGDAMTRTYFLCLNSDFILADGSLRTVLKHILDERSVILAPSFRVTRETVRPVLRDYLERTNGQFNMPPREMTRLAFKNIHPTLLARIVNQNLFHSDYPNQIYWRVDPNTLLARYYLIMQVCIRPERRIETINNFVDYGFLPEMCPSGDMVAIADSDDFFMMELQPEGAENFFMRPGPVRIRHVAKSLSEWTTARHRDISHFEHVFHTEDLPPALVSARDQLGRFMKKVEALLTPVPVPHDHHHYWPGAVQTWLYKQQIASSNSHGLEANDLLDHDASKRSTQNNREDTPISKKPYFSGLRWQFFPPNVEYYAKIKAWNSLFLGFFWGLPPHLRLWHPHWWSFYKIKSWLKRYGFGGVERVLYVTDETDFDGVFNKIATAGKILPRDLLGGFLQKAVDAGDDFTACFIHLTEGDMDLARRLAEHIFKNLPSVKKILCYVEQSLNDCGFKSVKYSGASSTIASPGVKSVDCTTISTLISWFSATFPECVRYWFIGGFFNQRLQSWLQKRFLRQRFQQNFDCDMGGGWLRRLVFSGGVFVGSFGVLIANLWNFFCMKPNRAARSCSGIIIEIMLEKSATFVRPVSGV